MVKMTPRIPLRAFGILCLRSVGGLLEEFLNRNAKRVGDFESKIGVDIHLALFNSRDGGLAETDLIRQNSLRDFFVAAYPLDIAAYAWSIFYVHVC